ncbi:MAG: CpsD/CapB family tyrosine-protein kinase [Candidatus Izemoplasmatales bacterium]|uniref:non-specific protein-tyrosine kinase n=1 Tax=Hujiaoplasma nucleasis TaxID=2725268 RepID=A0A7L6N561_9MOLU|nr:CpsD/CapB family tyrosine-protein kinase [Hujiaoplasma nucleasis]QLY40701.1 CpsD/CapB family tyrosine-protein kinase [Hujiaoplasma nucleasis]
MEFFEYRNVVLEMPNSPEAEAYRKLELNIRLHGIDKPIQVIQTTSATPRDGKTTTAINLAAVYRERGKKTLIIDFDLRKPKIHRAFKKANDLGFYDYIVEDKSVEDIIIKDESGIDLILSGQHTTSPHIILESKKTHALVDYVKSKYDVIIVDSPPVLSVTDAFIISKMVEGVIYVVAYNQTKKEEAKMGLKQLQDAGINILGSVFANVDPKITGYSYNYYYSKEE